jgi:hypothetical protein
MHLVNHLGLPPFIVADGGINKNEKLVLVSGALRNFGHDYCYFILMVNLFYQMNRFSSTDILLFYLHKEYSAGPHEPTITFYGFKRGPIKIFRPYSA